ncbi:hypothetical protein [Geoalkalibacter sp.]|uniref:hypothetical protein n=1 Tax=Geoalkalibacter sp. TaxID=3041440 RepID=UPI00272E180A|nr:hypothetical protein [Geoalkalibacter sp.]
MDFQVSLAESQDYILIKVFKPMTTEISQRFAPEAIRLAEEHGIKKYLFDVRQAPNVQSVSKNYMFAHRELPEIKFPRASISAFLISENDKSHEFIELAFKNAGYLVKSFTEEQAALAWLKKF